MKSATTPARQKRRPRWAVKLVVDGPLKMEIGAICLQYGQEPVAIGATRLFAKADIHKGEVRVLIAAAGGDFGKPLPISVRLYRATGDVVGDTQHGFYFYSGMLGEIEGQNFIRLELP